MIFGSRKPSYLVVKEAGSLGGVGDDADFKAGFWKDSNMSLPFFFIQHQLTPLHLPLLSQLVGACR